ncbi:16S rRNA processing protein RimM [Natronobacillus azotifigens]|uniref:Ribosome maturation factor RimM n=1 Tax=Natronobacillus azotifigens TaxID=472978 RepID=A0A9J6RD25_9BACI|nr:ribosome maturation factor RimM [Natronobacillus azotifigens]MCZ0703405.1 ribosome maturation factor RimM [Natronobacillus azotifigens]
MTKQFFNVGKIVNTHGIKGEVKVVRITDFEERFQKGNTLYFSDHQKSEPTPLTIKNHRKHKQFDMLQFEGYDSINQVESMKQGMLMISQEQQEPLEEGEFFYYEIIGCTVETTEGERLGEIAEILSPGANDVWVVRNANKKDLLIPYIDDVVKTVDKEQKKVVIEPMEGLIS